MSLVKDVKNILQQNNIDGEIYLSFLPEKDNAIVLYSTGGFERDMAGNLIEQPTFQARIRNIDYEAGWNICEKIKDALHKPMDIVVNGNRYLGFYQQSDIMDLGRDSKNRSEFSVNFRCYVHRNNNV